MSHKGCHTKSVSQSHIRAFTLLSTTDVSHIRADTQRYTKVHKGTQNTKGPQRYTKYKRYKKYLSQFEDLPPHVNIY